MVPVALDTISWHLQPVLWIRSWFRLGSSFLGQCGSGSCSGSGSRDLMKVVKVYFLKKIQIKTCNTFISRLLWKTSKLQKKPPALNREYLALHFFLFCGSFFVLLDQGPDPTKINANPDPQHGFHPGLTFSFVFSYGSPHARVRYKIRL